MRTRPQAERERKLFHWIYWHRGRSRAAY